jgi:ubiquinone/menaquinone biosynthesis C-methylase UbiE
MIEAMLASSLYAGMVIRSFNATEGQVCCSETWEEAYQRFETPQEERSKFRKRLAVLGAAGWPRDASVAELFCGRGNGLAALTELGFGNLEGVDLSPSLLATYTGPARTHVADCRQLPFPDRSRDILIVQGGLHHLNVLPDDLQTTLAEAKRVLRPGGRFVTVEPWLTPFLSFVHAVCAVRPVRRVWGKLDALATMNDIERPTYEQWLGQPELVLRLLNQSFTSELQRTRWGKLMFVGRA